MTDLRDLAPAGWGLAGATAYGFHMVLQAFRTPKAKLSGPLELVLGTSISALAAMVFNQGCCSGRRAWTLGPCRRRWVSSPVPALHRFIRFAQRKLLAKLSDDPLRDMFHDLPLGVGDLRRARLFHGRLFTLGVWQMLSPSDRDRLTVDWLLRTIVIVQGWPASVGRSRSSSRVGWSRWSACHVR